MCLARICVLVHVAPRSHRSVYQYPQYASKRTMCKMHKQFRKLENHLYVFTKNGNFVAHRPFCWLSAWCQQSGMGRRNGSAGCRILPTHFPSYDAPTHPSWVPRSPPYRNRQYISFLAIFIGGPAMPCTTTALYRHFHNQTAVLWLFRIHCAIRRNAPERPFHFALYIFNTTLRIVVLPIICI